MAKQQKPRITFGPADVWAEQRERIIEIYSDEARAGCLISVQTVIDETGAARLNIDVYRRDANTSTTFGRPEGMKPAYRLTQMADERMAAAFDRYTELYDNAIYSAATEGMPAWLAIELQDDALALCGDPQRKWSGRNWSEAAIGFLSLFTESTHDGNTYLIRATPRILEALINDTIFNATDEDL